MTDTPTRPKRRTWVKRGLAATGAAAALTVTSVMGGATMTAQGPEHTPTSVAVTVLNPLSADAANAWNPFVEPPQWCDWWPPFCSNR